MSYSTKIKIAAIIGGIIIVIMFMFMVVFVENNSGTQTKNSKNKISNTAVNKVSKNDIDENSNIANNKDENTENIEKIDLQNIYSFAIHNEGNKKYLVGISSDLDIQNIINLNEEDYLDFQAYDYFGSDIYLLYKNVENKNFEVYKLDLETLEKELVYEGKDKDKYSFEASKGNIAFASKYIAFSDGKRIKITDYDGNVINENLYTVNDNEQIFDIAMLTDNALQIRIGEDSNLTEDDLGKTYLIDFSQETINEVQENYYNVIIK